MLCGDYLGFFHYATLRYYFQHRMKDQRMISHKILKFCSLFHPELQVPQMHSQAEQSIYFFFAEKRWGLY